jgi:hypothetical protein
MRVQPDPGDIVGGTATTTRDGGRRRAAWRAPELAHAGHAEVTARIEHGTLVAAAIPLPGETL